MSKDHDDSFIQVHREVQRKFGRCMFRLQQYELLAKSLLANHELSVTADTDTRLEQAKEVANKTLGAVVKSLTKSFLTAGANKSLEHREKEDGVEEESTLRFSMKGYITFGVDEHRRIKAELKALVALRNDLAHHFIETFDIWTVSGCMIADSYLENCYSRVDAHFVELHQWAKEMEAARAKLADFLSSPSGLKFFLEDGK